MFTQTHGTWGERLSVFGWDGGLMTILFLKANNRCSWHSHQATWNRFVCITGKVGIKTEKGHTTELLPKQMFEVEPNIIHEFQVYEDSIIAEIAYAKYDESDIERKELGSTL